LNAQITNAWVLVKMTNHKETGSTRYYQIHEVADNWSTVTNAEAVRLNK
jgi:hypothetical protein